jgi:NCAIR mutase (PurE)-related protein
MVPNPTLQELLSRYKNGEITLESAAEEIEGLRLEHIGDFACIDLGRSMRCGMPEVVNSSSASRGNRSLRNHARTP